MILTGLVQHQLSQYARLTAPWRTAKNHPPCVVDSFDRINRPRAAAFVIGCHVSFESTRLRLAIGSAMHDCPRTDRRIVRSVGLLVLPDRVLAGEDLPVGWRVGKQRLQPEPRILIELM